MYFLAKVFEDGSIYPYVVWNTADDFDVKKMMFQKREDAENKAAKVLMQGQCIKVLILSVESEVVFKNQPIEVIKVK